MFTTRKLLPIGIVTIMVLALSGTPTMAQGSEQKPQVHITQVDTSQFPTITVYISVTDDQGEPAGIEPERLELEEDGRFPVRGLV